MEVCQLSSSPIGRGWIVCVELVVEVGKLGMELKERKDLDRERERCGGISWDCGCVIR